MPAGNATPRDRLMDRISLLQTQIDRKSKTSRAEKLKSLLQAYTTGYSGDKAESSEVRALRRRLAKMQDSALTNARKNPDNRFP